MKKYIIILIIALFTGLAAGKGAGDIIIYNAFAGKITIFPFMFSPSQNLADIFSLLNSESDYKRLEGYYAYSESGIADTEFLIERFKSENSGIIRKVIIWTGERNFRGEKLVDFYRKLYSVSSGDFRVILSEKIKIEELE